MLFRDSPEQAIFREELRHFLDQELPSSEWNMRNDREEMNEDEAIFTRSFRNKLAERGWLTLGWPTVVEQISLCKRSIWKRCLLEGPQGHMIRVFGWQVQP